ncbi:hypothetical protein N7512_005506 [Penicillium capsulatum]|nr:hypothetical protein N7512_005506 [Penicillium capsulatum]
MDTSVSPMEVPTGATTLVSSMQSYYDYGLSQSQLQDAQGYDTDQIDRWCMESMLVQSMYSNPAPYPEMNPLSFSGTEMASSTDPLFEENLDVLAKQFLSFPQSADLPSSYPAGLTGDLSFTFVHPCRISRHRLPPSHSTVSPPPMTPGAVLIPGAPPKPTSGEAAIYGSISIRIATISSAGTKTAPNIIAAGSPARRIALATKQNIARAWSATGTGVSVSSAAFTT